MRALMTLAAVVFIAGCSAGSAPSDATLAENEIAVIIGNSQGTHVMGRHTLGCFA